jgi:hypothetical protein
MTIRKAIGTVLLCTLLIGAVGTSIGFGLGKFSPGYYRAVCRNGYEAGFDPVSVGVGLGLTQGITGGIIVGLATVALLCWRETNMARASSTPLEPADKQASKRLSTRQFLWTIGMLIAFGFCLVAAWMGGFVMGDLSACERECARQRNAMRRVLRADPAFSSVIVGEECDDGWIIVGGSVKTQDDHSRLREQLTRAVGKERADYAVGFVQVK